MLWIFHLYVHFLHFLQLKNIKSIKLNCADNNYFFDFMFPCYIPNQAWLGEWCVEETLRWWETDVDMARIWLKLWRLEDVITVDQSWNSSWCSELPYDPVSLSGQLVKPLTDSNQDFLNSKIFLQPGFIFFKLRKKTFEMQQNRFWENRSKRPLNMRTFLC